MKKIFLVLIVAFFASTSRAQNDIVVDPNASERILSGSFNAIKISGGIDLYLSQSAGTAIAVSAATENLKEGIKTAIENGTLKIFYEGDKSWKKETANYGSMFLLSTYKKLGLRVPAILSIKAIQLLKQCTAAGQVQLLKWINKSNGNLLIS